MFTPLSQDFRHHKYGLDVRLVNEQDTNYILSLRTNDTLSKFIHKTHDDVQMQLKWLSKYKIRESEGRDYYFIYSKDGNPVGVNRIYNIHEYYGTIGSWLCSPGNDVEVSMATNLIVNDIMFEILNLDLTLFDVRKANKHVWKMHKSLGAKMVGESEIDYYFVIFKNDYFPLRDKMLNLLNIK